MKLNINQARTLSMLFTWRELHDLNLRAISGEEISFDQKSETMNVSMPYFDKMVEGRYTKENIDRIIVEWKEFFKENFLDVYNREIETILSISE